MILSTAWMLSRMVKLEMRMRRFGKHPSQLAAPIRRKILKESAIVFVTWGCLAAVELMGVAVILAGLMRI